MNASVTHRFNWKVLTAAVLMVWGAGAHAQASVFVQGPQVAVTADDLRGDALMRVPEANRPEVLSDMNAVGQVAQNLYVRRVMAQQAREAGLADAAEVQAAVRIAQDKVLSDLMLARIDKTVQMNDALLDGVARDAYRAKPERFKRGEEVRVSHILVRGEPEAAREKAQKLLDQLKAGASFEAMAKEQSEDPGSRAREGDLGWFEKGRMVPEFEEAAFALQKDGELSDLVKTQFGYHILKRTGQRPAGVRPFEEVREELRKEMLTKALQDARQQAAQEILSKAKDHPEAVRAFAETFKPPIKMR